MLQQALRRAKSKKISTFYKNITISKHKVSFCNTRHERWQKANQLSLLYAFYKYFRLSTEGVFYNVFLY